MSALDGLDDIDWSSLEDAYGPAIDVPKMLRALAAGNQEALGDLHAHVFHQGASYYPATAPCVPFLVALALDPEVADRQELVAFLAELSAGHARTGIVPWDPYAFRSTPVSPSYPQAQATLTALRAHLPVLHTLLAAEDPALRAATGHLLAGLGEGAIALRTHLGEEPAPLVRASHMLSLARSGGHPDDFRDALHDDDERVAICAAVALTWVGATDDVTEHLARGALLPASETWDAFPWGPLAPLCAGALRDRGRHDPTIADRIEKILEARFARGDELTSAPSPPHRTLDDDGPPVFPEPSSEDEAIRTLVVVLTLLVFSELGERRDLVLRDELDDRQRRILRWTVDHGVPIPVPGIPWFQPDAMRRYLDGDGHLEAPFTHDGRTWPLWRWLREVKSDRDPALRAILRAHEPEALFALVGDLFTDAYGKYGPALVWKHWAPIHDALLPHAAALEPLLLERAAACEPMVSAKEAYFYVSLLAELGPLDPRWDDLLARAAFDERALPILETLPIERRSRIAGKLLNPFTRKRVAHLVEGELLARATLDLFPSKQWWADRHQTRALLVGLAEHAGEDLAVALLEETVPKVAGVRAELLQDAVAEIRGVAKHTLRLGRDGDAIHAVLLSPEEATLATLLLPANPADEHLGDLVAALESAGAKELHLTSDDDLEALDSTALYRLQRILRWEGMRSISYDGGGTLHVG